VSPDADPEKTRTRYSGLESAGSVPSPDGPKRRPHYLTAPQPATQLHLLDTQIEMVKEAADLVKRKGRRVRYSVTCLAIAAALVVSGALAA
jgi:hypothetical protein